jgi:hypothetical protein
MAAIFFCSGTDEAEKQARREVVKSFRSISGTQRGEPFKWSVLQYTPVRVDGRPI